MFPYETCDRAEDGPVAQKCPSGGTKLDSGRQIKSQAAVVALLQLVERAARARVKLPVLAQHKQFGRCEREPRLVDGKRRWVDHRSELAVQKITGLRINELKRQVMQLKGVPLRGNQIDMPMFAAGRDAYLFEVVAICNPQGRKIRAVVIDKNLKRVAVLA
jgi:hypothetical protein